MIKNIKSFKTLLSIQKLLNIIENKNYLFFFYYTFFTSNEKLLLDKFLKKNNLNSIILKKSQLKFILKKKEYIFFKNMLKGNVILIYLNKNSEDDINFNIILSLINHTKLTLIGVKWFNKIYRANIIKKYINNNNIKYNILQNINTSLYKLLFILSYNNKLN